METHAAAAGVGVVEHCRTLFWDVLIQTRPKSISSGGCPTERKYAGNSGHATDPSIGFQL